VTDPTADPSSHPRARARARIHAGRRLGRVLGPAVALALVAGACSSGDGSTPAAGDRPATAAARFTVQPGTREVSVTGVKPKEKLTLVDPKGKELVTLGADKYGQVHFAYLPDRYGTYQTGGHNVLPTNQGYVVPAGDGYTIRDDSTTPVQVSKPFRILGRDDHPAASFYDRQAGKLGPTGDETKWYGYITTRDGTTLSATVRLPGPPDEGPYPTVVEYSGYDVSDPANPEPGSLIAGLLGFATVGVNLRGTGCSGGAFDVFNVAQHTDGYDVIEAIARQPWVKHHKVGMVGLSYSGITQLFVASTAPPSLAAITPLSVIKDPWLEQWPGGVYNGGFTKQWLAERDSTNRPDGTSWVTDRLKGGDTTCKENLKLREQNVDFESFGRSLERRPPESDERDLSKLVQNIDVPVYLTGAWQDEQTGPQFADMLGSFDKAPVKRFTLFNGRHPDGYSPLVITRWWEFLELYVDGKVPKLSDDLRKVAPGVLGGAFGSQGLGFEPDRFADFTADQYDQARQAYEAQPDVRVLFESGAGDAVPGNPVPTFERDYATWPPKDTAARSFYLGDGTLEAAPGAKGEDAFANDPASGQVDFFGKKGYELLAPTWDLDWTRFPDGTALDYVSKPFDGDTVLGGPGYAELWMQVPDGDADVQVSVNLVRPDGTEWHVTTGLLRLSDRKVDAARSTDLHIDHTYSEADAEPMPKGEAVPVKVPIPSFAQAVRAGDRLHVTISSPGRDFGAWLFETIGKAGTPRTVARGQGQASRLVLGVLPSGIGGVGDQVPALDAPCPSLRGQACRTYVGPLPG
jgi:predicted acyl esterase